MYKPGKVHSASRPDLREQAFSIPRVAVYLAAAALLIDIVIK